ncbi:hypothetical protein AC1031_022015 [Aphanomyces cochlioides]|nr:hypothetical protein AC1031_022015 [Aphanomyces cochlioides]
MIRWRWQHQLNPSHLPLADAKWQTAVDVSQAMVAALATEAESDANVLGVVVAPSTSAYAGCMVGPKLAKHWAVRIDPSRMDCAGPMEASNVASFLTAQRLHSRTIIVGLMEAADGVRRRDANDEPLSGTMASVTNTALMNNWSDDKIVRVGCVKAYKMKCVVGF